MATRSPSQFVSESHFIDPQYLKFSLHEDEMVFRMMKINIILGPSFYIKGQDTSQK
jgi:hypothetical protein